MYAHDLLELLAAGHIDGVVRHVQHGLLDARILEPFQAETRPVILTEDVTACKLVG